MATDILGQIGEIWDEDAAVYDESSAHCPQRPEEVAAWRAALRHLLPHPPARVLDAGAGTGFISLLLADQGYEVTAIDLSTQMLTVLRSKADRLGVSVRTIQTNAVNPPSDQFFERCRGAPFDMDFARSRCSVGCMA